MRGIYSQGGITEVWKKEIMVVRKRLQFVILNAVKDLKCDGVLLVDSLRNHLSRNHATVCQWRIRKRRLLIFLPNVQLFQYSVIPG